MANFSGGVLDIPGLMPVNIGSSNPYPVPFAPQIRPQSAPVEQAQYAPGQQPGSTSPGLENISGFGGGGSDGTSPTLGGGVGDPFFTNFGGYGGSSPDYFGYSQYAPGVHPAQLSSLGSIGLGDYGQGLWDRISSIGNSPTIRNDNLAQAGVNAAGLFSPLASILAGAGQGLNLWDGGLPTGNAAADVAMTPGVLQQTTADLFNWINRQFGGEYMPLDLGRNTVNNSPGIQSALGALSNPYDPMGGTASGFTGQSDQGVSDHTGGSAFDYGGTPYDPYSLTGNMWDTFMQGATFGGGRFDNIGNPYSGIGGGGGFGGGGFPVPTPDNNGGWGQ